MEKVREVWVFMGYKRNNEGVGGQMTSDNAKGVENLGQCAPKRGGHQFLLCDLIGGFLTFNCFRFIGLKGQIALCVVY